ncbi:acetyl-CoA carboxylase biotin carboxylase subunit family protein [Streptomyces sp. NPDC051362]|uniref:acetyl-CoA carboxylase biotin carboxylase subunit family protein n=1 Tax=Streptomyces sp. NPDC051362 TaxID=3365651 RepID=UPI00379834C4
MSLPRVGVIHSPFGAASIRDIKRSAAGLCDPVILFTDEVARAHEAMVGVAAKLFEVAVAPQAELVDTCRSLGLKGVTTFHDAHVEDVDVVAVMLGLPGAAAVESPWDKFAQRQYLRAAGLTGVRCFRVDCLEDFERAIAEVSPPCVLKPRRGVGGSGVAFLQDLRDVQHQRAERQDWMGLTLETWLPQGAHPVRPDWLGNFVSVETVSTGDEHHAVAVFDKSPIVVVRHGGREGADAVSVTGDIVPSQLPRIQQDAICAHVRYCLETLGVRWRVTHTEVQLTPDGMDIIEINGRMGGHLNRLLRLVGSTDLVKSAFSVALGVPPALPATEPDGYAMGYFPPFSGRTRQVMSRVTAADLRRLDGIVGVDEVAARGSARADSGYRMANVTLRAGTADELHKVAIGASRGIRELFAADAEDAQVTAMSSGD